MRYANLWAGLAIVILGSFAILGYYGIELYRTAPPVPTKVVAGRSHPEHDSPPRKLRRVRVSDARESALVN